MANLAQLVKLLHILSAIAMMAGIIGRQVTQSEAAKTADFQTFQSLIRLSGRFDTSLVRPGSTLLLLFGLILSWMLKWPLFGFLQGASTNWLLVSLILYLAIIPLIAFVLLPKGKAFEDHLEDARAKGEITDGLRAALTDRSVRLAHFAEAVIIAVVIYLMVMKPF